MNQYNNNNNNTGDAVRADLHSAMSGESQPNTRLRAGSAKAASRRRLLMTQSTFAWPFLSSLKPGIYDDGSGYLGPQNDMPFMEDEEMEDVHDQETFVPIETVPVQEVSTRRIETTNSAAAPVVPLSSDPWILMRELVSHFAIKSFERLDMKQIRDFVRDWLISRYEKEFKASTAETFKEFMKQEIKKKISAGITDSHVFSVTATFERSASGRHHLLEPNLHNVHVSFESSYRKKRRMSMNLPIPGLLHMESSVSVTQEHDMSRIWNVIYHTMKRAEKEDEISYSEYFDQCVSCFVIHATDDDSFEDNVASTATRPSPRVQFCVSDDLSDSKCVSGGDDATLSCTSMPGFSSHVVYDVKGCIKIPEKPAVGDRGVEL